MTLTKKWELMEPKNQYQQSDSLHEKLFNIYGIKNKEDFMYPKEDHTYSSKLLKNIESLTNKILEAIKNKKWITIFADNDYDGLTSGAILYKYVKHLTDDVDLICAQRSAGHGLSAIMGEIDLNKTRVLIAVDSSSNDIEECELLSRKNIEVLIIDHHICTIKNDYCILVNPQQEGCKYPNKNSCGGLLVYKVCEYIDNLNKTNYAFESKCLPGFSLAADMMPMDYEQKENRFYFHYSLNNVSNHYGLKRLFEAMNKKVNSLKATDFTYGVSPAISSATRLESIETALELLLSYSEEEYIPGTIESLLSLNEQRKILVNQYLKELSEEADTDKNILVFYAPQVQKGIRGLVAQEISQIYGRPSVILGEDNEHEFLSGSYRSQDNIPFMDLVNQCEYALYGAGHMNAGGTKLSKENLNNFILELHKKLDEYTSENVESYILEFKLKEINQKMIEEIEEFYKISGHKFKEGKFLIKDIFVEAEPVVMGKLSDTVKIRVGKTEILKFKTNPDFAKDFPIWSNIEVLGNFSLNEWPVYNKAKRKKEIVVTKQILLDSYREV